MESKFQSFKKNFVAWQKKKFRAERREEEFFSLHQCILCIKIYIISDSDTKSEGERRTRRGRKKSLFSESIFFSSAVLYIYFIFFLCYSP
jgi:hypothetical protein